MVSWITAVIFGEKELNNRLKKEIGKIEKAKKNKKFKCLFPGCNEFSIGSHSQQRGGQLSAICRNNEVYAMDFNMYSVLAKGSSAFELKKTMIKNASIYPGFCQSHDGQIFSPIEKKELRHNDPLQIATFFLRTITYEITRKKLADFATREILNNCEKLLPDELVENFRGYIVGRGKFIEIDAPYYYDKAFSNYNYPNENILTTHWVTIPKNIYASSCTVFSPIFDIDERLHNQMYSIPQAMSTFNLVPTLDCTHVIVSWLTEHDHYNRWIVEVMNNDIEKFINYVAICESEDICLGPNLWEKVDIFTREEVLNAMKHVVHRGPFFEMPTIIKI